MCKNKQKYEENKFFFLLVQKVMRKLLYILTFLLVISCGNGSDNESANNQQATDTIPMLVTQMQRVSRLYTAEYHVHKIITHDDQLRLQGSIMKQDFTIDLPVGDRRIAIPMDATVKSYVDMGAITKKNIKKKGDRITVILPDPKIELTSTKINHAEIKKYVAITRSNFTDAELANYEQQGRKAILKSIPQMDITETSQRSAANALIPLLTSIGFKEENITITFRKKFSTKEINQLISTPEIEKRQ